MEHHGGELKNKIAVLRAERGMTQKELAQKAGVSRQTIISIEKGRYTPSLTLAFIIANVFEVDINEAFQFVK